MCSMPEEVRHLWTCGRTNLWSESDSYYSLTSRKRVRIIYPAPRHRDGRSPPPPTPRFLICTLMALQLMSPLPFAATLLDRLLYCNLLAPLLVLACHKFDSMSSSDMTDRQTDRH